MRRHARKPVPRRRAFSLIEMVAATTILSLSVVTIAALSTRSVARTRLNREYEAAWDVLDRQLTMIDYIGIEAFLQNSQFEGRLGQEDGPMPVYTWKVQVAEEEIDGLYSVRMAVAWGPEKHPHMISAETILGGTPAALDSEILDAGGNSGAQSQPEGR